MFKPVFTSELYLTKIKQVEEVNARKPSGPNLKLEYDLIKPG